VAIFTATLVPVTGMEVCGIVWPSICYRGAPLDGTILIYGATGYTGRLIAKAASDSGARPILAGRNLDKVKRVAEPLGLSARAFDLGDPARIDAAIKDVSVVITVGESPIPGQGAGLRSTCVQLTANSVPGMRRP
jgi:short subunit dehydrogenase-like uncharacterized protein